VFLFPVDLFYATYSTNPLTGVNYRNVIVLVYVKLAIIDTKHRDTLQ